MTEKQPKQVKSQPPKKQPVLVDEQHVNLGDEEVGESEDGLSTCSMDEICECFSQLCFDSRRFEPTAFVFLSRIIFGDVKNCDSETDDSLSRFKGRIESSLLRKEFVRLSLTKH